MNEPKRIQRQRVKGWRMPEHTIYVGRPTKWGNPYPSTPGVSASRLDPYSRIEAVLAFKAYAEKRIRSEPNWLDELRGKDLACWCSEGEPCHAEVLLEMANKCP